MDIKLYLQELNKIELLSLAEEKALWEKFRLEENLVARHKIIESYQPLVFKIALEVGGYQNWSMDIVQEGTVGLIEAVERFDYTKGVAFSLFASHRIKGRIINYFKSTNQEMLSIDSPIYHNAEALTVAEFLVDSNSQIDLQVEQKHFVAEVLKALERLPSKERAVINNIYLAEQSPKELANDLNLSLSHIYRLQKQGVRRLRGMLAKFKKNW